MVVHVFPAADRLTVRSYAWADGEATERVLRRVIVYGAEACYSRPERMGWWWDAALPACEWHKARSAQLTWVAERRGDVVGFVDLTSGGEVLMLYVDPDHTRQGIGSALLDEAERAARAADMPRLSACVSRVAEPLFGRAGFVVVRRRWVELGDERLAQAVLEKLLEPVL